DVLVGGGGQILGEGVRNRRRCGQLRAASDLRFAKFRRLSGIALFGGGNDRCRATLVQIKTQDQRIEEVFGEIEAALPFGVVFKVPVPTAGFPHLAGVVSQIQGRQSLVRSEGRQSRT